MPYEYRMTRRIEFAETDMAGIAHFANFFRMMENTEHAFFRSLGFSIHTETESGAVGWPRVSASCEFLRPLRFEDEVEIQLLVLEIRSRSIRYAFRFWKMENGTRQEVARGGFTTVCTTVDKSTGNLAAITIPEAIRNSFEVAPAELISSLVSVR